MIWVYRNDHEMFSVIPGDDLKVLPYGPPGEHRTWQIHRRRGDDDIPIVVGIRSEAAALNSMRTIAEYAGRTSMATFPVMTP